jgi:DnaJ homolog subfamily C member 8
MPPPQTTSYVDDLEKVLSREASALQRELEVERILKAFKLKCAFLLPSFPLVLWLNFGFHSPYDILDIEYSSTQEEIKRRYRQLSLGTYHIYAAAPALAEHSM